MADDTPRRHWIHALGWIAGAALFRAVLSALVPLLPDETYYWEWSRRLEAGYFDHPPGVAFLIALGAALFGPTHGGVRFGPVVAAYLTHIVTVVAAWQLAGRGLEGARSAKRAAILVSLLPIATLGLVLATPDALLFLSTTTALLAVERALAAPVRSLRGTGWWTLAGVALGGAFVAKYTAVLLPFALVVACVAHPALRRRFADAGPWMASAIALGLFAPVVVWNWFNDWVSFRFQLGHGFNPAHGNPLLRELEMVGGQIGLASPILFVLMSVVIWHALRDGWRMRHTLTATDVATRRFALAVVAVVPLLFFAVSAWRRPVEANWPAMIYPAAIILLATAPVTHALVHGHWWRRGLTFAGAILGIAVLQAAAPVLPVKAQDDPIARAYGWDSLATAVDRARHDPWLDGTVDRWVAGNIYQDASELAFHLPDHPTVFSLNLVVRTNQYDVWRNAWGRVRPGDGLVLAIENNTKGDSLARVIGTWFDDTKRGETVALRRGDGEITTRQLWLYRIARDFPREKPPFDP
ncbi:MAG: glycosyltransferase family 39 protein [Gemmatimonadaceae bacterium]|nr:glycosyltransferase family 39 protein [Gemmatimonadaceae bacterium]